MTEIASRAATAHSDHRLAHWIGRAALGAGVVLLVLFVVLAAAGSLGSEPLRRQLEARVNDALEGYTATIGDLALRPWNLGIDLQEVRVMQDAQPDPPVMYLPSWTTHLHWGALLSLALVAHVEMEAPEIHVQKSQAEAEARDPTALDERGWQDAVTAVYPLEIHAFEVRNGTLTYAAPDAEPVVLENVDLHVQNIRNVRSLPGEYPSPVEGRAQLQKGGRLTISGRTDLLATPSPAVTLDYDLTDLAVGYLAPLARPWNVILDRGRFAADGHLEWTAEQQTIRVVEATLADAKIEYRQTEATAAADEARLAAVARAATDAERQPATRVDVEQAHLRDGELAYVHTAADPSYRLFVSDLALDVRNFSNQEKERAGTAHLTGQFMGSGRTEIDASFRGGGGPDFEMDLEVAQVSLPALNDLLRAQAGFDVKAGRLSVFSEVTVRDGRIDGYVKPLISDLDVYDEAQEEDEGLLQKAYEGVVGGVAKLLENPPRDEIATRTDLSGPVDDPQASTIDVVVNLLRNAFVDAILPQLDPTGSSDGEG